MRPKSTSIIYFSPTKTSKRVLEGIARGIDIPNINTFDLTQPIMESHEFQRNDALIIFGAPVYDGRIPKDAVERFRKFKGNNTPAVVVVVYGNRAFEDALLELETLVKNLGFNPFAGAAFIGEHSFSTKETPIASLRPDKDDLLKASDFGKSIRAKLENQSEIDEFERIKMPGNFPYKKGMKDSDIAPVTRNEDCVQCGTCVDVCPKGLLRIEEVVVLTNTKECILCCACIKECPTQSRVLENDHILHVTQWLHKNCSSRKEPELFMTH